MLAVLCDRPLLTELLVWRAGIMGGVVQGMAFGTGSQLAGRALDSVMGARQVEHVHTNAPAEAPGHPPPSLTPVLALGPLQHARVGC
jgi:hypothetical protein